MKVDFTPVAESDLQSVVLSFEQLRNGLGDRILGETRRIVVDIEQFPESYPLVGRQLRRVNLSVIPFQLYYAICSTRIPVLGLLPGRMYPPSRNRILNQRLLELPPRPN